jgi:Antidote-toxin recognition MazE, bacterial antitoxin
MHATYDLQALKNREKSMSVLATLRKSGNSVVVTIPREELEAAGVNAGDTVSVSVRPVDVRPRLRADLRVIMDREFPRWQPALEYLGRGPDAEV